MDTALLGTPVPLPALGKELKKLWESAAGAKTRASLVNFAVLCEGTARLEANTELISQFTREHSCRAILISRDCSATETAVEAYINAHCHLARAGAKQVCCEQITLLISGGSNQLLSNTLFANLDSDLPLYLWWQGELHAPVDDFLWAWVDRLIFDSAEWTDAREQFRLLETARQSARANIILCDLNWTRTLHLRQALAQMFDHPNAAAHLAGLDTLTLVHGPGSRLTAELFAAWVAAQLGWQYQARTSTGYTFAKGQGSTATVDLREGPGAAVSCCELSGAGHSVSVRRDAQSAFYHAEVSLAATRPAKHLLPAGGESIGDLLDEELTLGGRHAVYRRALAVLEQMVGA